MNKINICAVLFMLMFFTNVSADKKHFLTVDELVDNGYILLSGQQILEIMNNRSIKVVDIETAAVSISEKSEKNMDVGRKFVETKSDEATSQFDPQLMARAPALEGEVERKVVGDELIATDGLRSYHYRLYKKQAKIFAVRDIDHGNVFFEIKVK